MPDWRSISAGQFGDLRLREYADAVLLQQRDSDAGSGMGFVVERAVVGGGAAAGNKPETRFSQPATKTCDSAGSTNSCVPVQQTLNSPDQANHEPNESASINRLIRVPNYSRSQGSAFAES
ncbi:hypothetical protein P0D72_36480 [Paraburkholderia sediminicola]|uniref:hypothetical protein n=1 Tax=Paraburkholderia sediminicola TaxID=458836 RepID=UPI0038B91AC5